MPNTLLKILPVLVLGSITWRNPASLYAQAASLPLSSDGMDFYHEVDRLELKTGHNTGLLTGLKEYDRGLIAGYARALDSMAILSKMDRVVLQEIFLDNNEWLAESNGTTQDKGSTIRRSLASPYYQKSRKSFLKHFYPTPANLLEVNQGAFFLRANPVADIRLGSISEEEDTYFYFRRGVTFRGGIDDRIFFYSRILETQARFPDYIRDFVATYQAVPGEGFIKPFASSQFGFEDGRDFLNSQSYLGLRIGAQHSFQLRYGRNFIGNGIRSLMLSDFSNNYFHLKFNWNFGKFYYQNIFAELLHKDASIQADQLLPKKYLTAHYLGWRVSPQLNIALFEATVFQRLNRFKVEYFNPIILYRSLQNGRSGENNVLLGIDVRYNLLRAIQLYGQMVFNNLSIGELFSNDGSWERRFSYQAGLKYVDVLGVDHLDLQIEYNGVRPYTYMNGEITSNYVHYNQPLAHPLGANFKETIFLLRYRPVPKIRLQGRLFLMEKGEDPKRTNWGGDLAKPYLDRVTEEGNTIGQGVGNRTSLLGLEASYALAHNVFIDLFTLIRREDSEDDSNDLNTTIFGAGFRANLQRRRMDF